MDQAEKRDLRSLLLLNNKKRRPPIKKQKRASIRFKRFIETSSLKQLPIPPTKTKNSPKKEFNLHCKGFKKVLEKNFVKINKRRDYITSRNQKARRNASMLGLKEKPKKIPSRRTFRLQKNPLMRLQAGNKANMRYSMQLQEEKARLNVGIEDLKKIVLGKKNMSGKELEEKIIEKSTEKSEEKTLMKKNENYYQSDSYLKTIKLKNRQNLKLLDDINKKLENELNCNKREMRIRRNFGKKRLYSSQVIIRKKGIRDFDDEEFA